MTVSEVTVRPQPWWRRVVSVLIIVYMTASAVGCFMMAAFAVPSGSMDPNAGTYPGVLVTGTFTYRYHNASTGQTVDIPVTAPHQVSDPGQVVVDTSAVDDQSDFGPFGYAGHGSVTLPNGVHLAQESNGTALLQPLRTGSRLALKIDSPVGWRGRLIVALPSTLIWTGLGVALLMFGTFLRSIFTGRPFHPKNPRRLLWLGGSLGMVVLADSWLRVWITRAILDVLNQHGHRIPLQVDSPGINTGTAPVIIIGALCLAGAFRAGTQMAADTDGLV